jgi:hypothetical protein
MDILRCVLKDCHFTYNDVSSSKKDKQDIEVSFHRLIVCFRHTFLEDTFKMHIEFCGATCAEEANMLAQCIAKMSCVVDSPELVLELQEIPKYISAVFARATMYNIAKLLMMLTRFPLLENHEENIL